MELLKLMKIQLICIKGGSSMGREKPRELTATVLSSDVRSSLSCLPCVRRNLMSYTYKHTHTHTSTHALTHTFRIFYVGLHGGPTFVVLELGRKESEAAGDLFREFSLWFLSLKGVSASEPGARLKSQGMNVLREKGVSGAGARESGSCLGS